MKKIQTFVIVSLIIYFLGHFSSCQKDEDYEYFLIQVDSVSIPETILANQPFELEFYGYIGHNGCYSFSKFVSEKQNKTILFETWGKLNVKSTICSDALVYLNGKKIEFLLEEAGNYNLKIKQPDGTFLERQFLVE
jgi:hypothetical protein